MSLIKEQLLPILQFTTALAIRAGALILEGSNAMTQNSNIGEKKNSVDLVTEYDTRVEEMVKKELGEKYPTFQFIGEESYAAGARPALTPTPTFCVDPIDGTTNFIHGFPFVCISIGLIDQRRPVLGVVYNPFLDHLYTGIKGGGSYLTRNGGTPQGLPLSAPKPLASLSQALIAVEWGSDRAADTTSSKAASFRRLAGDPARGVEGGRMAHSLRSMGSAALNFAMVAQGGMDLYWEIGCWPWDVCAGIVLAEEAGGMVVGSKEAFHASLVGGDVGDVTEEILTGRKYLVIRAIGDTPAMKGFEAQKNLVRDFYDTVEDAELR